LWVLAYADSSGKLRVRFSSDGADPVFLAGVELHAHETLPIVYQRTGGLPLQGNTPGVSAFVNAFNNHDHAGAETLALAMTDDFEQGVALTYLIGWLEGSRDGNFHHLDGARSALMAAGPGHPGAAWLMDELTLLERALSHLDASGHTMAFKSPAKGGKGYLNPDVEGQIMTVGGLNRTNANAQIAIREMRGIIAARNGATVLEDLVDWNQGAIPANAWEPSPLIFACLKLTGASMLGMNPKLAITASDPDSVALAQDRDLILENLVDLGFASADFPKDLELVLLDH
jgi:hypothetical protein